MKIRRIVMLMLALALFLLGTACGKAEVESTILTNPPETTAPAAVEEAIPSTEPMQETTEPSADPTEETTEPSETPAESTGESTEPEESAATGTERDYVLNTNSKKFHYPDCSSVSQMKESNRADFHGTRDAAIAQGYDPCGRCKP